MQYILANLGVIPREEAETKGRQLVMAALAADDRAAEIHTAISQIFLYIDDDFASASRHADRAVALNPAYAEGLRAQSIVRKIEGRFDEAVDAARASVAIASTPGFWNGLGETLLAAGRTAEAVDFRIAHLRATGRGERAAQLQEEAGSLGPDAARRRDLLREVEQLVAEAGRNDPFEHGQTRTIADRLIVAYAELGDWTNAVTWVERSYAHRPGRLRRVLMDLPINREGLASDRRYARLLRVAGLEGL